jgi:hypothetical protein
LPDPTKFTPGYDYSDFQESNPTTPLPGDQVDNDFANLEESIDEIVEGLKNVRRSDGRLKNQIVRPESLHSSVVLGIGEPEDWLTATAYAPPDAVWVDNKLYRCILAHTSGVFATDLAALKWSLVLDLQTPLDEAEASATAAAASAAAAATAETNAETAETNAETAETNAETAATTATTQAGIATTQAGIATTQATNAATSAATAANANDALIFAFSSTTTDADPGAGAFRLNNATASSATAAYIDNTDAAGSTVSGRIDSWDDSSNTVRGTLTIRKVADAAVWRTYSVSGSVVDGTGYRKLTLTHIAGAGSFTNADVCALVFSRAGDVSTATGAEDNPILNPDMEISQGSTSVATAADGTIVVDRYVYNKIGAVVHTVSRDTDVPTVAQAGRLIRYSYRLNLTTPDDSVAASDEVVVVQKLEGSRFRNIAQRACKIRFWVKATQIGTYSISLRNDVPDQSCVLTFTINVTDTWEEKILDMPATPSSGTWSYASSTCGLRVGIVIMAGSTFQASSANTWLAGYFHVVAGQTNGAATGATNFRFTAFEIYPAAGARPVPRSYEQELALCRRLRRRLVGGPTTIMYGASVSASTAAYAVQGMAPLTAVTIGGSPKVREEGVGESTITGIVVTGATEGASEILATCGGGLTTDRPVGLRLPTASDYVEFNSAF